MRHCRPAAFVAFIAFLALPEVGLAQWRVAAERSPMHPRPTITVSRNSSNLVNAFGGTRRRATLQLRCREGRFEIYVVTGSILSQNDAGYASLRVRFDDDAPIGRSGPRSTSGESFFLTPPENVLVDELLESRVLHVEYTPIMEGPIVATFPLAGLRAHIGRLADGCPSVAAKMGREVRIAGTVYLNDSPVSGAVVFVEGGERTQTDSLGRFSLPVAMTTIRVVAMLPDSSASTWATIDLARYPSTIVDHVRLDIRRLLR